MNDTQQIKPMAMAAQHADNCLRVATEATDVRSTMESLLVAHVALTKQYEDLVAAARAVCDGRGEFTIDHPEKLDALEALLPPEQPASE